MNDHAWRDGPPEVPGLYLVRPRAGAFLGRFPERQIRVVRIAADAERSDGGDIAGTVDAHCWQWSGPVETPNGM